MKAMYDLKAEEKEVSSSQVEDVYREAIPLHVEAQKPQHYGISNQPNQGNDEGKEGHGTEYDGTKWNFSVGPSILCCDVSPPVCDVCIHS